MKGAYGRRAAAAGLACLLLTFGSQAADAPEGLPKAVREAVVKAFPGAAIRSFGLETEKGVQYYEVNLLLNGNRIEVEVDRFGGIGEIERRIGIEEAPEVLAKAVREATGGTGKARIERHERWGVAREGRFVKLQSPRVFYEVKLSVNGTRRSAKWHPKPASLTEKAKKAIEALFPRAVITEVEKEVEDGVVLYEVALIQDGRDFEVEVSGDGIIAEVESSVATDALPKAVKAALEKAAGEGRIQRVGKVEARAEVKGEKLAPLAPFKVTYEALLRKGDVVAEVEVSAEGRILEATEWKRAGALNDDDEDDDDDD